MNDQSVFEMSNQKTPEPTQANILSSKKNRNTQTSNSFDNNKSSKRRYKITDSITNITQSLPVPDQIDQTSSTMVKINNHKNSHYISTNNIVKAHNNASYNQSRIFKKTWCNIITDYILILVLILLLLGIQSKYIIEETYPYCIGTYNYDRTNYNRIESCGERFNNITIASEFYLYKYKTSDVSNFNNWAISGGTYFLTVIISLMLCMFDIKFRDSFEFKKLFILVDILFRECATSVLIADIFTSILKYYIGRPRPHFFNAINDAHYKSSDTQPFESFPSGHATISFSFQIMLTLHFVESIYWEATNMDESIQISNVHSLFLLPIWRKLHAINVLKYIIFLYPSAIACWISSTRIRDYWHHHSDVIAGAIIGSIFSFFGYIIFRSEWLYYLNGYGKVKHHKKTNSKDLTEELLSQCSING